MPFSLLLSILLPIALLTIAAPPVNAQRTVRVRPAFEPNLIKRQTVSGVVRFRIVARQKGLPHEFAPIGHGGWAAVIRVDGHILASCTRLPAVVEWDTRRAGDGIHEVHVAVRNERADQEVGVEGTQLVVDNAAADTATEAAEIARKSQTVAAGDLAPSPVAFVLTLPEKAKVTNLAARFSRSQNPLATRATALLRSGTRLYIGLPDGGIAFCAPDTETTRGGSVVRLPVGESPVQSLAVGDGRVWWVTESGRRVYVYSDTTHSVTRYEMTATLVPAPPVLPPVAAPEMSLETVAALPDAATPTDESPPAAVPSDPPPFVPSAPVLPPAPAEPPKQTGWVRSVVILGGKVLLTGDAGTVRVLDPRSGKLAAVTAGDGLLPEGALVTDQASPRLYIATTGESARASALVVAVTSSPLPTLTDSEPGSGAAAITLAANQPAVVGSRWRRYQVRAWRSIGAGAWRSVAAYATDADPSRAAPLAVSPDALATAEREGLRLKHADDAPRDLPYDLSPGMPSSTDRVSIGHSGLWWEQRGIVFRADPRTGARDAFLPWNVPGDMGAVLALAADEDSVWVATTSAGVRRIRPGRPTDRDGYNGYVRARLGSGALTPPTPRDIRIAGAIEEWQGVPYVWGGQSRSGADCSGFVMRMHQIGGVSIPRTSAGMRHASQGKRVRDELRWGDTLVYPGHCAIYIGDGRTAETVGGTRGGSVSHSSIWVRSSVVIRRFLR